MDSGQFFQVLSERMRPGASVDTVYGKPIEVEGKTIIPVAKVSYGFGGGIGEGHSTTDETEPAVGSGMGGGGWVRTKPIAVLEITGAQTRVIPIIDFGRIALMALLAGVAIALLRRR